MNVTIELDEKMVAEIDFIAENLQKKRGDCVNELLRKALRRETIEDKIRRHKEGYKIFPVQPDEFEIEDEQMEKFWEQI